jgi:hypothetical protein
LLVPAIQLRPDDDQQTPLDHKSCRELAKALLHCLLAFKPTLFKENCWRRELCLVTTQLDQPCLSSIRIRQWFLNFLARGTLTALLNFWLQTFESNL